MFHSLHIRFPFITSYVLILVTSLVNQPWFLSATIYTRTFAIPAEARNFSTNFCVRPDLEPIQPPVQLVLGVLSAWGKRGRGVTLTIHPHLVPRSWISRIYTSSPLLRLHWCVVGLLYSYKYIYDHSRVVLQHPLGNNI
jgi:hypothetical protein